MNVGLIKEEMCVTVEVLEVSAGWEFKCSC